MGSSAVVICDSCGFEASVMYGPGMLMIELVPCVCRACRDIVNINRVYTWVDADGNTSPSGAELAEAEARLGVSHDPPMVCPDCAGPVARLLSDEPSAVASAIEPCPQCGESLRAEWDGLLWD